MTEPPFYITLRSYLKKLHIGGVSKTLGSSLWRRSSLRIRAKSLIILDRQLCRLRLLPGKYCKRLVRAQSDGYFCSVAVDCISFIYGNKTRISLIYLDFLDLGLFLASTNLWCGPLINLINLYLAPTNRCSTFLAWAWKLYRWKQCKNLNMQFFGQSTFFSLKLVF